jgi:hypothetical protein
MERSSPFRLPYENVIKTQINTYSLNKLSRFNPVDIARMIPNHLDVSYSYNGSKGDLNLLLRNDLLYLTGVIYNFTSNYSNLTCSINLTYYGQKIRIETMIKNGHLESFNLQRTNLDLAKSSKDKNYFYDSSRDKIKELLRLTEPCKVASKLRVFMQSNASLDYGIYWRQSSTADLVENRGRRSTDMENSNIHKKRKIDVHSTTLDSESEQDNIGDNDEDPSESELNNIDDNDSGPISTELYNIGGNFDRYKVYTKLTQIKNLYD